MLGKLAGKKKTNCRLDLTRADGRPLVVVSQATGFGGDALEDVVDERVHDGHGLAGDASVGVDLLQHLVDVDGVALLPTMATLLFVSSTRGSVHFARLGSGTFSLDDSFGCHFAENEGTKKTWKSFAVVMSSSSPEFIQSGGAGRPGSRIETQVRTLEDTEKRRENSLAGKFVRTFSDHNLSTGTTDFLAGTH